MGVYIFLGLVVLLFSYVASTDSPTSATSTDSSTSQGFNMSMNEDSYFIGGVFMESDFIVDGLIINDDDDDNNMFHDDFSL
jgi:hypothetical protein